MKGRRSVWSDPRIRKIALEFVPAADEVGRLQAPNGRGPEAELFQKIAEQGHYAGRSFPTSTRQGTYAAAPNGRMLASINTNDPDEMLEMLRRALDKWRTLEMKDRLLSEAPAKNPPGRERVESLYPEGGLVLQHFCRDLPRKGASEHDKAWNQDFAWFTREEARALIPPSREPGARHAAPPRLVHRLAKYHLIDTVRGQTRPFNDDHVKRAELTLIVEKVEGDLIHLRLEGATRTEEKGDWQLRGDAEPARKAERGYEAKLLGRATVDLKQERFTSFDLVAVGSRWGGTQYNGRARDLAPAPMGVVFRLAATTEGPDRVAPAFAGSYYFK